MGSAWAGRRGPGDGCRPPTLSPHLLPSLLVGHILGVPTTAGGTTMSDTSQGPGWWLASDGKWYPPQPVPQFPPPPPGVYGSQGPGWWQGADGRWYPPQSPFHPPAADLLAKKRVYRRGWFWVLIVVALGFGGCVTIVSVAGVAVDHEAHVEHTVVYSVTGTGTASSVLYRTFQEGNNQYGEATLSNVSLPWSKTVTVSGLITAFDVVATVGIGGGSIECTITEDGRQIAVATATGRLNLATCNAVGK